MPDIKKLVAASDFHIPFYDPILLDLFYHFLADFKPDILVINGDFLDCASISKFDKVPHRHRFKNDLEIGKKILRKFRDILPNAEIYYIEGNHSFRLRQYIIRNAPELYEIYPTLKDLLELDQLRIEWIGTKESASRWIDTYKRFGQLYIGHFDRVNKHSGMTAKALVEDKGISVAQAHVHRLGQYNKRLEDGTQLVGLEMGCMCDLDPNYMGHANWQSGWLVVYLDQDGSGRFHHTLIHALGYRFFFNGKDYNWEEISKTVPRKLEVEVL